MGDRTFWREDCKSCGGKDTVDCYDAPSCLQYHAICDNCGWTDGLDYYEIEPDTIALLTKEQAKERGIIEK